MAELTAKQKWTQLGLGLGISLAVCFGLVAIGARAPYAAIPAVAMWLTPWIEWKTTGKQPKNLALTQCAAIGLTIAYLAFELAKR